MPKRASLFSVAVVGLFISGCTVHPAGEREERTLALQSGQQYQPPFSERQLPLLPDDPAPEQLVNYALVANADLEQRYWAWRAAVEQIPQDGTQSSALNLSAGTSLTRGRASWDSSTIGLANDPMTDIKWPGKLDAAAKQSLENARAAGQRYLKAKYDLRAKVLTSYFDYALTAELIRLEQGNQQLLQTTVGATSARSRAGNAGQEEVLKAENEADLSRNDITNMQSQIPVERAAINALLNRASDAPLPVPRALALARMIAYQDNDLLSLAARRNPELTALADETRGHRDGVQLAKLQYMPDFNLSAGTDLMGMTQSVLGQATIPVFRYEALNAAIAQAEANLHASQAMQRQAGHDLSSQVVADLAYIKDADRQLALFQNEVLPRAQQIVDIGRSQYETGHSSLLDLLDGQRSLISVNRLIANLKTARERHLVDLESLIAIQVSP